MYGDCMDPKKSFVEDYKGVFILKGLIQRQNNDKFIYRLINILLELTKIEEKDSNLTEMREIMLKQIIDSDIHIILLKFYADLSVTEDTKSLLNVLLLTLKNIYGLFNNIDDLQKVNFSLKLLKISEVRKDKIKSSKIEDELKKEELELLEDFLKFLKENSVKK